MHYHLLLVEVIPGFHTGLGEGWGPKLCFRHGLRLFVTEKVFFPTRNKGSTYSFELNAKKSQTLIPNIF